MKNTVRFADCTSAASSGETANTKQNTLKYYLEAQASNTLKKQNSKMSVKTM